ARVNLKKYEAAIGDFTIAIKLDPNYEKAYYNRGSIYLNQDRHEKAVYDFVKAAKLGNEQAQVLIKHFEERGREIRSRDTSGKSEE
ncbi:MAG TPA: tetratricopeptide repeat protein, partial [bacterium]|nr:tetratricopeptide repeat protein [bacterium]